MKSFLEDDSKEGRYFPNETELQILVNYLRVYFSHPERSPQRSQVVQQVVSLLSNSNKHWSHRTVRLWFNNNKKVYYHPSNSTNGNQLTDQKEIGSTIAAIAPPYQPPKKTIPHIPPRSLSVVQFPPRFDSQPRFVTDNQATTMIPLQPHQLLQQQQQPIKVTTTRIQQQPQTHAHVSFISHPTITSPAASSVSTVSSNSPFANNLMLEKEKIMMEKDKLAVSQEVEQRLSAKITAMQEQLYEELVSAQSQQHRNLIRDISSLTPNNAYLTPKVPKEVIPISNVELIEASSIVGPQAALVAYLEGSEDQYLCFNGRTVPVGVLSPVTSMAFSEAHNQFFLQSDGVIKSFSADTLEPSLSFNSPRKSIHSAMTFLNGSLILACGSSILTWSKDSLNTNDPQFKTCLTSYLKKITSITTVANFIVVASNNHHTPHIFADNGTIVARPIGHVAGVTALGRYDDSCFLTGSADQSTKLWDIRTNTPVLTMLRHKGIVTAVSGIDGLVLSGGTDGIVRGWDLRNNTHIFSANIGTSAPLEIGVPYADVNGASLTVVTSEIVSDSYLDLQKYGPLPSPIPNIAPNSILSIKL